MIAHLGITFGAWLVLILIGTNLIGMLIRGLALKSEVRKLLTKGNSAFRTVASEFYKPSEERRTNIIAFVLIVAFLGVLFYFWNRNGWSVTYQRHCRFSANSDCHTISIIT